MSRVFKSCNVIVDENNRVNIDISNIRLKEESKLVDSTESIENNKDETNIVNSTVLIKDIIAKAELDASIILEKAKLESEKIKNKIEKETLDNIKKIKEDAYDEGYKEGFDLGKKEAEKLKKEATEYSENLKNSLELDIVNLIEGLIKKILFYEVDLNPKIICALVKSGLSKVSLSSDEIKVRISTDDFDQVKRSEDIILNNIKNISNVTFIEDSNLCKSDCIIETSFGNIDCSLLSQYNELHKNLYYILNNG